MFYYGKTITNHYANLLDIYMYLPPDYLIL